MSKPVILIPGLGASILINKKHPYNNYFGKKILSNRWVNLYPMSSKYMERWKQDMYMEFKRDSNQKIIGYDLNPDIQPYDVYGIQGIQNLVHEFDQLTEPYKQMLQHTFHYQYMYDLNTMLQSMDYSPKKNLIGMPYDFRSILDPSLRTNYFKDLKHTIETKYYQYRKKVVLISHSLGGILLKWFLTEHVDERFTDTYIDQIIIVNSPFGGTPNAVKACMLGEFYVPFMQSLFASFTGKVSGIIMSLPNPLCYKSSDIFIHMDESNPITLDSIYKRSHSSFEAWNDLYRPYLSIISKPLNIPTHIILSTDNQTAKSFYIKNKSNSPYKIEYDMNGDGLIPSKSLHYATKLFYNYTMLHIPKSDHVGILSHPLFLDKIKNCL